MKDTTILIIIILFLMILTILIIEYYCYLNKKTFHEIVNPSLYNKISIDEKKLKPKKTEKYLNDISEGYKIMKDTRIIIGGLFKDSAKKFPLFKKRINNLSKYFKDLQVVIFENDSSDN